MRTGLRKRNAQVSTELLVFLSFMLVIFLLFLVSMASKYKTLAADKERLLLKDQAHQIRKEIFMASTVEDGYFRSFTIPGTLEGMNYSLRVINNVLVLESKLEEFSLKIPPMNGTFVLGGMNRLERKNGVVCVNGAC